jgi:hypothetical protein
LLGGEDREAASGRHDHVHLERDQLGRERRQPFRLSLGIPVLDQEILALGVTEIA